MFNANLKKTLSVSAIALVGLMGAANVSAQQYWMEEVLEEQLRKEAIAEGKGTEARQEEKTSDAAEQKGNGNCAKHTSVLGQLHSAV